MQFLTTITEEGNIASRDELYLVQPTKEMDTGLQGNNPGIRVELMKANSH